MLFSTGLKDELLKQHLEFIFYAFWLFDLYKLHTKMLKDFSSTRGHEKRETFESDVKKNDFKKTLKALIKLL